MITGFLKPDWGEIRFAGREVTNLPPYKLPRMGIARSWQDVRIFQGMTVLDNVLVARQGQEGESLSRLLFTPWRVKRQHREHWKRAFLYLSKVGLRDRAREVARNLSYAEQKLLAMARLLSTEAEVLLLDEPSSGVDPKWVKRFMRMIDELSESGKTICLVEHNLEVVKEISDIVYFMAEGNKAAEGTAEELMRDPKLSEIYFGL
jgi:branched-chain amino acid transport system ATP-binding protein/branched-chain amino acid transport system permease protein